MFYTEIWWLTVVVRLSQGALHMTDEPIQDSCHTQSSSHFHLHHHHLYSTIILMISIVYRQLFDFFAIHNHYYRLTRLISQCLLVHKARENRLFIGRLLGYYILFRSLISTLHIGISIWYYYLDGALYYSGVTISVFRSMALHIISN